MGLGARSVNLSHIACEADRNGADGIDPYGGCALLQLSVWTRLGPLRCRSDAGQHGSWLLAQLDRTKLAKSADRG